MSKNFGYIIWGFLLSVTLLLACVEAVAFNLDHYKKSFVKYSITEATNMNEENLDHTIKDVLKYFKDKREVLDTRAIIAGEEREVFGTREKLHMIDVKELFIRGGILHNISILLIIILGLVLAKRDRYWKKSFSNTCLYTSTVNLGLLVIFLLMMKANFDKYFTYFHLIFFNNDLWLLDPNTEVLIQMLPEGFFYDSAFKIVTYFVSSLVVLGLTGLYFSRKNYKYITHEENNV